MQTTFVRTRHNYDSYQDFWKLVELSGFSWMYLDEVDPSVPGNYILSPSNGEFDTWVLRKDSLNIHDDFKLILWQLERPLDENAYIAIANRFDEVWVSDIYLYNKFKNLGPFKFVLMGSNLGLASPGKFIDKHYDYTHMSYINGRRMPYYGQLQDLGVTVARNAWGSDRDMLLSKTKFGLTIHQDDIPATEPLRIAMYAAYGLPVLSEEIENPEIYNGHIFFVPLNKIIPTLIQLKDQYSIRAYEDGLLLRSFLCVEHTFARCVREAVVNE